MQNKVRPGAYINFTSAAAALGTAGERGTALLPLMLPFGPSGRAVKVDKDTDVLPLFGARENDPCLLMLRECAKRAQTVLVWRLDGGAKASCTDKGLTVMARYGGEGGNKLAVKIAAEGEKFRVETWLDGLLYDSQTAGDIAGLQDNALVEFSGEGPLSIHAGLALSGGDSGGEADYDGFFAAAALLDFNTMAVPSEDEAVKGKAVALVKRLREEEGRKIQAVLTDSEADYEGVISVKNGVTLADGTAVDKVAATAYAAGMTAGAAVNKSCTYDTYDGAVDASPRFTESGIVAALKAGHMVFTPRAGRVIIEQDQNTLVSFTPDKGRAFHKNRTVRVLDQLAEDVRRIFEDYYLGKASNNADGRRLFQAELLSYLRTLADISAIEPPENGDVTVAAGAEPDTVVVTLGVKPVDSMEKLYMTVTVG